MFIDQSIDIEDEIREALDEYMTVYVRPLPENYDLPNILVTQVGGTDSQKIDTFAVVLDSRAETESEAVEYLNRAKGLLKEIARQQTSAMRHVTVNSSGSWGTDPVRPDLKMCSARIEVTVHQIKVEVKQKKVEVN